MRLGAAVKVPRHGRKMAFVPGSRTAIPSREGCGRCIYETATCRLASESVRGNSLGFKP